MAIKFVDKVDKAESGSSAAKKAGEARAAGEARFATPIEAVAPVNPDAGSELPFTELPRAEKKKRGRKGPPAA
ncbi:hypothetical protein [Lichenifustis flavocetrariae]|uniref:Uncharacterized protein n=1 Tax=Lichenifustis flavocetrariae TaxID=2949735 RepID=A0AA41Z495_9HYPH|nr:hypothetical protein [Lichenifustis flavocetrariae]MCW6508967.1 hypothetical protein [Lichenifustis flavocetrariae]